MLNLVENAERTGSGIDRKNEAITERRMKKEEQCDEASKNRMKNKEQIKQNIIIIRVIITE